MSSIVFLLCLLSAVRSVDLRANQRGVRNDDSMIEELFQIKEDEWKDNSDVTFDKSESRLPRIWKTVQYSPRHYNPCTIQIKHWKTNEYLNQKQYDFQPDEIRVKHCNGTNSNGIVKRGCRTTMDCVTTYERRKFMRKTKGAPCTQWYAYQNDIPVGCECMISN
ncbi:uncharacterized protein LOC116301806 [Actinia tenebrosa]|uniref:Uncharacterized protein LOC116301806 n=1 Tax=Actinia tenebrosa TaxID=6105 RepID=A0A6P8IJ26_ACTTE|nr:uncharacterized protein LOC116301806 [Actinia tenebrosa]